MWSPWKEIFLVCLSILLLIFSFPRFDIELLAWISLVPLLIAIKDKNLKYSFGLCFITGIGFFMGLFYWINEVNAFKWVDFILSGVYLSFYTGLFGLTFRFIANKTKISPVVTAPVLWVSLEYLRSHAGFLGVPWALLGHSQYLNLPIIQISSLTGVYGVSFLIVMVNATLSELLQNRFRIFKPALITLIILVISFGYGFSVLSKDIGLDDKVTITLIQGNIPQDIKWKPEFLKQNFDKHVWLTTEASNRNKSSLIVWPEGSVPGPLRHDLYFLNAISTLARETETPLLIGSSEYPKFGSREFRSQNWYNSAYLVSPKAGIERQYNKIYLLPFAEYRPYKDSFPWPSRYVSRGGDFIPGNEYTIFNISGSKFGVVICWESIFPELFRQFVREGAQFMVNITNEAWFGKTAAPYQFVSMNVFRAVENRVSIARSANTGISCFIDPFGRIMDKVMNHHNDIFVEGYLMGRVPLSREKTFYTIYGDIFVYLNMAMAISILILSCWRMRNRLG